MSSYTEKLQYIFSDVIEGLNFINAYFKWYDLSCLTTINQYTHPISSNVITGEWWQDSGDLALIENEREVRVVCKKGKLTFKVTGKTIIIRVFLNPSFGSGLVYIDGVKPSDIANVLNPMDEIITNSDLLGSWGNEYVDFVLADNLEDIEHTIEVYCNNTERGNAGYFAVSGAKGCNNSLVDGELSYQRDKEAWILIAEEQPDILELNFKNIGTSDIKNLHVKYPYLLKNETNDFIPDLNLSNLSTMASSLQKMKFDFDPFNHVSGLEALTLEVSYEIQDENGSISHETTFLIDDTNTLFNYVGSNWSFDEDGGETRHYTDTLNEYTTLTINSSEFVLRIQKEYGWGRIGVYVDNVFKQYVDCHDDTGGGFYVDITISGLTDDTHSIKLNCEDDTKYIVFSSISYNQTVMYSLQEENVVINTNKSQVPPYNALNMRIENQNIVCDTPENNLKDLSVPVSNVNLTKLKTFARVPTYCVYYSTGRMDILKQYDIVIIDPFALTRNQVIELQSLGIIVLGYISFGEEDSTIADIYDPNSEHVPYIGDGLGVGGYASYYCKGGNEYGEVSECEYDNQRMFGIKSCAKSNPNYLTDVGRCSKVCWNDWRDGYKTQMEGGSCGGGHDKSDYWERTAETGCSNSNCPDYHPLHEGCTQYKQAVDCWGQDFTIETTDFPDENGIWASYYINPLQPSWQQRIEDFYMKVVLGEATNYTKEVCNILEWEDDDTSEILPVCRVAHFPIDSGEDIIVMTSDESYTFEYGVEYTLDDKLGTFRFTLDGSSVSLSAGDTVKITYTNKGLQCDGIFMDTVDTVDVYPSSAFQNAFSDMINDLKALYPSTLFCSNRGFSILEDIIASCEYVMFESFLSDYNWETDIYEPITDPDTVEWNNQVVEQLKTLRENYTFDVFALNYCHNDSRGDELREYIYGECRKLGFLCWTSTILLNEPLGNIEVITNDNEIDDNFKTNKWRLKIEQSLSN